MITIFLVNNVSFSQDAIITGKVRHGNEVLQAATITVGEKQNLLMLMGRLLFQ